MVIIDTRENFSINSVAKLLGKRVVRGPDWEWNDQDGGSGCIGVIVKVFVNSNGGITAGLPCCKVGHRAPPIGSSIVYTARTNTVLVRWDSSPGQLYNYRTGYDGKYDLRAYEPGTEDAPSDTDSDFGEGVSTMIVGISDFQPGEAVRVVRDLEKLDNLGLYGAHNPNVKTMAGKIGVVRRSNDTVGILVSFAPGVEYAFHSLALVKIFRKGAIVRITKNKAVFALEMDSADRLAGRIARITDINAGVCRVEVVNSEREGDLWIHANCLTMASIDEKNKKGNTTTNTDRMNESERTVAKRNPMNEPGKKSSLISSSSTDEGIDISPSTSTAIGECVSNEQALFTKIRSGNLKAVIEMITAFPRLITARFEHGATALHIAAMLGNVGIVECLSIHGGRPSLTDDDGDNVLHCAVHKNQPDLVEFLVRFDPACLNAKNRLLLTPFHLAVRKKQVECVQVLMKQKNIDLNTQDSEGDTPLHDAIKLQNSSLIDILMKDQPIASSMVLKNKHGSLPFHLAICLGNVELVRMFLTRFSQCISENLNGNITPVQAAVLKGHSEVLSLLLESAHYDINAKSDRGSTALHMATAQAKPEIVEILIQNGADLSIPGGRYGMTAAHFAAERVMRKRGTNGADGPSCLSLLNLQTISDSNATIKELMDASQSEELAILCYLLMKGADGTKQDTNGRTLFDILPDPTLRPVLDRFILLGRFGASIFDAASAKPLQRDGQQQEKCILCADPNPVVTFMPCGHRMVCIPCLYQCPMFKICPQCSTAIDCWLGLDNEPLSDHVHGEPLMVAALKEENTRLREKALCHLCYDRDKEVAPPCGHSICRQCAYTTNAAGDVVPRFSTCPYCRRRISGTWVEIK